MITKDLLERMEDVEKWFEDNRYASTDAKIHMMIGREKDFKYISKFGRIQPEFRQAVNIYNKLIDRLNQEIIDNSYKMPEYQWVPNLMHR